MAPSISSVIVGLASCVLVGMILGDPNRLQAESPATIEVGPFSTATPGGPWPDGWKPLTFPKISQQTTYQLVKDVDRVAIKAASRASSSGYTKEILIDPNEYPITQWEWKVWNILKTGNVAKKDGDDYPARINVTFQYDSAKVGLFGKAKYEAAKLIYGRYPPLGAINYIRESRAPVGTAVPTPYTEQAHMIVVESGPAKFNTWMTEERNLYEDYKRAFGADPPMISGIAIMTDTDNTANRQRLTTEILSSSAGATEPKVRIDSSCLSLEPTRLAFVHRRMPYAADAFLMRFG